MTLKRTVALGSAGVLMAGLVAFGAVQPAFGWTAKFTGTAVCSAADGSATITWTIDNTGESSSAQVKSSTDTAIPVNSAIGSKAVATYQEIVSAPAAGKTVAATINVIWPKADEADHKYTATVSIPENCTPPVTPPPTTPPVTPPPTTPPVTPPTTTTPPASSQKVLPPIVQG